jgi:gamma-glutamylcyclotransferase (GGCT)/AIG2-like uncharacterized protein YtfP
MAELMTAGEFVFFYGTLLPQFVPPVMRAVVGRMQFCGEGSVRGVLYDLGEYPGAVVDESANVRVYGAVFRIPEGSGVLEELDHYEGYDPTSPGSSLFARKRCEISMADGSVVECWIYEYNGNPGDAAIIASGRYRGKSLDRGED